MEHVLSSQFRFKGVVKHLAIYVVFALILVWLMPLVKPIVLRTTKPERPAYWPLGIVVHHSDTPFRIKGKFVDASLLDRFHKQRGFSREYEGKVYHIAYHYVILPDGTIQKGRPDYCIGAHAGNTYYNKHYLGVCLIGAFDPSSPFFGHGSAKSPTSAQMSALQSLCVKLCVKYEIPVQNIIRHRDANWTYCPGRYMPFGHFMQVMRKQLPEDLQNNKASVSARIAPKMHKSQNNNEGITHSLSELYTVVLNAFTIQR